MRIVLIFVCFFAPIHFSIGQFSIPQEMMILPTSVQESSGAIWFNNQFITHNDSGSANKLYVIDTLNGTITRTITVLNANNTDWEDLAQDSSFIYIGDFGNNNGNRTDLKVYKIAKADFLLHDSVTAEIIEFQYANQVDFSPAYNNTAFDAEALVSGNDTSLVIFSKNWVNHYSLAYVLPKTPGNYNLSPLNDTLFCNGLITGAVFDENMEHLTLVGYSTSLVPFIINGYTTFSGSNWTSHLTTLSFTSLSYMQIEAICQVDSLNFLLSSESLQIGPINEDGKLFSTTKLSTSVSLAEAEIEQVMLCPNPSNGLIKVIHAEKLNSLYIYNTYGECVYRTEDLTNSINLSSLPDGVYFLVLHLKDGETMQQKIMVVN